MAYKDVHKEIEAIYEAKNSDYGNSAEKSLDNFGLIAGVVRIGDKYERLVNLVKNPDAAKVQESLSDTLKDMANYCIIAAAWLNKQK